MQYILITNSVSCTPFCTYGYKWIGFLSPCSMKAGKTVCLVLNAVSSKPTVAGKKVLKDQKNNLFKQRQLIIRLSFRKQAKPVYIFSVQEGA